MKKHLILALLLFGVLLKPAAKDPPPVIGLCIAAPDPDGLDTFLSFMENDLAPGGINTLVLRIDFNYEFQSHPNMRDQEALSEADVKTLVNAARTLGIKLIPQINLLGHQSWASRMGKLLDEYPGFDENPSVKLPGEYKWPNPDGLYCKSYCPLHPEVHQVVFALVDEIMEVFEADAFHAGMDEVFYIGEDECPRCSGKDKAELFAGEVSLISGHLAESGKELWIWGDRLLDGTTTGMGMWEASENGTHGAIELIPKDVVICDWHYERADPTAALFALSGFRVITCPWNRPAVTWGQLGMFDSFRNNSPEQTRDRYYGFMQTVWSPASRFLDEFYAEDPDPERQGQVESLKAIMQFYGGAE